MKKEPRVERAVACMVDVKRGHGHSVLQRWSEGSSSGEKDPRNDEGTREDPIMRQDCSVWKQELGETRSKCIKEK